MRKLQLDHIRREALLVEQRACHAAESVSRLFVAGVAQAPKGGIDGVIGHWALARAKGWKEIASTPGERLKLAQDRDRLARERHDVRLPHFHPRSRDTPFRIRQVKLGPLRCAQLARSDKD